MQLSQFTQADVTFAIRVANEHPHRDGATEGGVRFEITHARYVERGKRPGGRITGVLRMQSSSIPGARRSASGRRTNSANWQVHYDFMAALFTCNPTGRIQSGYYGEVDYTNELDFFMKCGKVGRTIVSSPMHAYTGNAPITFRDL